MRFTLPPVVEQFFSGLEVDRGAGKRGHGALRQMLGRWHRWRLGYDVLLWKTASA
jgi:hypothetical protein